MFALFRAPREGGDPDPYTQTVSGPLVAERPVDGSPSPHPLPQGARARTDRPSPCGRGLGEGLPCFLKTRPPTPASPVLPPEGEDLGLMIFPLWGKWRVAPKGALFFFRVPREGGDPDPFAPPVRHGASSPFDGLRMRNERAWINTPHSQPSPPQGGKGLKRKPPLRFPSAAAQSFPKDGSTIRRSWPRRRRRRCGHLHGSRSAASLPWR